MLSRLVVDLAGLEHRVSVPAFIVKRSYADNGDRTSVAALPHQRIERLYVS